jgi:hypothetical protein
MKESPAYSFIKERVELEFERLKRERVVPWAFFLTEKGVRLTDFFGKQVGYTGGGLQFDGSPREYFWNGFIQPFLNDIVSRSFSETEEFCRKKGLDWRLPLEETGLFLKAGVNGVYQRMSDIDQRLRGKGYPNSVTKYDPSGKMAVSNAFIEERLSAELALAQNTTIGEKQMDKSKQKQSKNFSVDKLEITNVWKVIEAEYGVSKRLFGKKINFVKDQFKRKVIFRDVEQAFLLAHHGFSKPSVVLAGGVIEELLRLYLEIENIRPAKNNLDSYIKACEDNGLLKTAIYRLADSIRQFRNIVHLERESTSKYSISKATAKGAVSSVFTIANDFDA